MSDLATEPPSLLRRRARLRRVWHCSLVVAALLTPVSGTPAMAGDVLVFAAASLRGALDAVAEDWARSTGQHATLSFAGSSVLARQIQQGAPADVFVSANPDWMAVIEAEGLVLPGTQR
ncbi:MAG: molybdate ABC transporter substrate-binding protein, partial [Pseudomonadota bacterium]